MMITFRVEYEVRDLGAIGAFWVLTDNVPAFGREEATEAFRRKYRDRYEFRFPVSVQPALDERDMARMSVPPTESNGR